MWCCNSTSWPLCRISFTAWPSSWGLASFLWHCHCVTWPLRGPQWCDKESPGWRGALQQLIAKRQRTQGKRGYDCHIETQTGGRITLILFIMTGSRCSLKSNFNVWPTFVNTTARFLHIREWEGIKTAATSEHRVTERGVGVTTSVTAAGTHSELILQNDSLYFDAAQAWALIICSSAGSWGGGGA